MVFLQWKNTVYVHDKINKPEIVFSFPKLETYIYNYIQEIQKSL